MGNNYRFKLSDMIPNAWFYKLKDMGKLRKQTSTTTTTTTLTSQSRKKKQSSPTPTSSTKHSSKPKQPHQYYNPRKSYYFTRDLNLNTSPPNNQKVSDTNFHEPPRKSTKQRAKRRSSKSSNSPKQSCSSTPLDLEFRTDSVLLPNDESLVLFDEMVSLSNDDIIIDVDNNSVSRKDDKVEGGYDDSFSEHVLPPILTKPRTRFNDLVGHDAKNKNKKKTKQKSRMVADVDFELRLMTLDPSNDSSCVKSSNVVTMCKSDLGESESIKGSLKNKIVNEENASIKEMTNSPSVGGGRRLRLRINSPRVRSRKSVSSAASGRRSLSDSFAIVKSSLNPQRDFRESMMEMIEQNNIKSSKDLEDLLACYLSLNSDEYHDLIIKVFKQIWFDLFYNE
ncbi:hypothetical protein TanjilG_12132 [Lupinus angustifolius]|uniref:Transcription repressor n=1 Tax=Lupinus angustifolius TaxID=3871 RepID=A0A1J7HDP1_LUPAN|nr:PREDICTED: transcription repressor OFP1-like [Lupinus angustifolius]OIV98546.1 hypothetical protein TanjilG_12132 [Lupinus angustifolius]